MSEATISVQQYPPELAWMADGKCRGIDQRLLIPRLGGGADAAKKICETCVVRNECLEYALTYKLDGWNEEIVWGGMTKYERRHIQRVRIVAASTGPLAVAA